MQLVNHGISEELLERVKKVSSECFRIEREDNFNNSKAMKLLNELAQKNNGQMLDNADWEDVFTLMDDSNTEWPTKTPGFK